MDVSSILTTNLQNHYKKILLLVTASAAVFLAKRYMEKRARGAVKKEKKKIKEFPTIQEIQKFIEELPFDAVRDDKNVSLRDLLGELSEFSEDEDWKELIASVHTMYEKNPLEKNEDANSNLSVYEDPNVLTFTPEDLGTCSVKQPIKVEHSEDTPNDEEKDQGDGDKPINDVVEDKIQNQEESDKEPLKPFLGDGDTNLEMENC